MVSRAERAPARLPRVLIRDLDERTVQRLEARAARNQNAIDFREVAHATLAGETIGEWLAGRDPVLEWILAQ
jgi:plasmid stability protein